MDFISYVDGDGFVNPVTHIHARICTHIHTHTHTHTHLLYKPKKPSVGLSACPSDRYAGISVVSALIETGLARNES